MIRRASPNKNLTELTNRLPEIALLAVDYKVIQMGWPEVKISLAR